MNAVTLDQYATKRKTLIDYLWMKVTDEDWHGVADAAMDIRDLDSEVKGYKRNHDERQHTSA